MGEVVGEVVLYYTLFLRILIAYLCTVHVAIKHILQSLHTACHSYRSSKPQSVWQTRVSSLSMSTPMASLTQRDRTIKVLPQPQHPTLNLTQTQPLTHESNITPQKANTRVPLYQSKSFPPRSLRTHVRGWKTDTKHHSKIMSHESVWYSRPRVYGKGSREWYVSPFPIYPHPPVSSRRRY